MLDLTTKPNAEIFNRAQSPLFALNGLRPGPRLVATGPNDLIRATADMFWDRPDMATMRGSLVLRPEGQDPALDLPDDILSLEGDAHTARYAYLRVLGRMTALGMIQGLGVPRRWVA